MADEKKNVWQRISAVMHDLPYVQKKKGLEMGGRTVKTLAYEDLAAEVQPLLIKHGLVMLSDLKKLVVETIESEKPGYKAGDPPKKTITTIATVEMAFMLISAEAGGGSDSTPWLTFPGMGYDTSDKAVGKATTYCAKDFLRKTFVVPSGEEPEDDHLERPAKGAKAHAAAPTGDPLADFPGPIAGAPTPPKPAQAASAPKHDRAGLKSMALYDLCEAHAKQCGKQTTKEEIEGMGGDLKLKAAGSFGMTPAAVLELRDALICQMIGPGEGGT